MTEISKDVEKFEERNEGQLPAIAEDSPNAVIIMAMQRNYTPELIEKMMGLQERHEVNEARKAYVKAMAEFKANPPSIEKDKTVSYKTGGGVTSYSHASLANVTTKINSGLGAYGLSAAWETTQGDGNVTVMCKITHAAGHSESTSLTAGYDTSGSKNNIQAMGSTISYLQRYTLLSLTGLAAHDQDDDGQGTEPVEYISVDQATTIHDLLAETGANEKLFLKWCNSESVEQINAKSYKLVITELERKKAKIAEPGSEG